MKEARLTPASVTTKKARFARAFWSVEEPWLPSSGSLVAAL